MPVVNAHLEVCGHDVIRYVERQLLEDEDRVLGQVGTILARRGDFAA